MWHRIASALDCMRTFHERGATHLLVLLLAADAAFIGLHLINGLTPLLETSRLNLEQERGFPEVYQYLKYFWIVCVLVFIALRFDSLHYLAWALLFAYFLLDDSMQVHERAGEYLATSAASRGVPPAFGLRLQDYGELAVSASVGAFLLLPLTWAFLKGTRTFRKISLDLTVLAGLLIFFGVALDMAHVVVSALGLISFLMGTIEDGGEMLAVSLILWYAFLLMLRDNDPGSYLADCARHAFAPRSS